MNRIRTIKPSTMVIVFECVFLAVVFVGFLVLSTHNDAQPVEAASERTMTPDPTLTTPSVAASVDRSVHSTEATDRPLIDLDVPLTGASIAETPAMEASLPIAGTLEHPTTIAERMSSSDTVRTDSNINVGPLIRLQLDKESRQRFVDDASFSGPNPDHWWLPERSNKAFVLKSRGNSSAIYAVSLDTARCTKLASFPRQRYLDARGDETDIYLIRFDTSDKRFRLIADVFSLQTIRVTSTRTLLDLPPLESKRIDRVVWDPRLESLAFTLVDSGSRSEPRYQTHLVNLQMGRTIETADDEHLTGNSLPLGFSGDGQRLFLASLLSPERASIDGDGVSLIEWELTQNQIREFGSPKLPKQIPFQISTDGRWAIYVDGDQTAIWNAETGRRHATIPTDRNLAASGHRPRVSFGTGNQWIAYDTGGSLRILSTDTGGLLASLPEMANAQEGRSKNMVTLFSTATDSSLLVFGFDTETDSAARSHVESGDDLSAPWFRRISIASANAKPASEAEMDGMRATSENDGVAGKPSATFTNWMLPGEYDAVFARLVAGQKYPAVVEGRFHQGQRQYRACFVDRPEEIEFVTHHDQRDDAISKLAQRYRQRGFREVWRQSFVDNEGKIWWSAIWTRPLQ